MITVLIVVGVCWFVSAFVFVLALGISARHRSPPRPESTPARAPVVLPRRRFRFWKKPVMAPR